MQLLNKLVTIGLAAALALPVAAHAESALDVVKNRLEAANLGSYVLELHSHKATRKEVARTLADARRIILRGTCRAANTISL